MIRWFFRVLSISILMLSNPIYSQHQADNWFFGENAGLSFSSGTPTPIIGGALNTEEGCTSISDASGNLLFYTNGENVFNVNHAIMPNGTGLHGHQSSTQSAIIVPKPNTTAQFYIFTVYEHNNNVYGMQYSLVDMSLSGGLGEVVAGQKNIEVLTHCSEKVTAVKSNDCESFWVIGFANADENIDLLDLAILETDILSFQSGYYATDLNGDGNVDLLDGSIIEDNINEFIYSIHP